MDAVPKEEVSNLLSTLRKIQGTAGEQVDRPPIRPDTETPEQKAERRARFLAALEADDDARRKDYAEWAGKSPARDDSFSLLRKIDVATVPDMYASKTPQTAEQTQRQVVELRKIDVGCGLELTAQDLRILGEAGLGKAAAAEILGTQGLDWWNAFPSDQAGGVREDVARLLQRAPSTQRQLEPNEGKALYESFAQPYNEYLRKLGESQTGLAGRIAGLLSGLDPLISDMRSHYSPQNELFPQARSLLSSKS